MKIIEEVDAKDFIGKTVQNPITNDPLPIFPASFVDADYATGVVFSVPAHAPADYIALEDIKKNSAIPISNKRVSVFGRILRKHEIPSKRVRSGTVYHVIRLS